MTGHALKDLPLGTSDFAALRMSDEIYVDKTKMVFALASKRRKSFLARPRRFGKSLLVSTFESLFKHGLRDFHGLDIERLWTDDKTYNVVRLDFSEVKPLFGLQKFMDGLRDRLIDNFSPFGFAYKPDNTTIFSQLSAWMKTQPVNSLVLLIDEYDAPLTSSLSDPELFTSVRNVLSEFYSILKSNDQILRFVFITGITKFNKTNIFSELNNLDDISLSPRFGSLLGYTREELLAYFSGYIDQASDALCLSQEKLLEQLTSQYDGFCFERTAKSKVFAPWSLLKFFSEPESGFLDYWFESGGKPSVLLGYLKSHTLRNPEEYGREKTISLASLEGSSDVEGLSDLGLLTQAGYLTIKAIKYTDTVYLDYPNQEVKRAMAQLYLEQLLRGRVAGQVGAGPIVRVLKEESPESVFHILNRLFLAVDYHRYPVKDEASLRAYVQVYFAGAGLKPKIENHNAHGRSGLEVQASDRLWIFEFKVVRDEHAADEELKEAIDQVRARHYGEQENYLELKKIVLVFSIKERQFVRWAQA